MMSTHMRRRSILTAALSLAATLTLLPSMAHGQDTNQQSDGDSPRRLPLLGVNVSYLRFTQSRARDRFGDAFGFSPGFGGFQRAKEKGQFEPAFEFVTAGRNDSNALLVPVGIGYRRGLSLDNQPIQPYVGLTADFVGTWIGSRPDDIKWGFRPAYGGSAFIGVNYQNRGFLEARYRQISDVRGFDFSGVQLGAGVRF